jgi:hypothetical protein
MYDKTLNWNDRTDQTMAAKLAKDTNSGTVATIHRVLEQLGFTVYMLENLDEAFESSQEIRSASSLRSLPLILHPVRLAATDD